VASEEPVARWQGSVAKVERDVAATARRISRDHVPVCDPRRAALPERRDEPSGPRHFGEISGQFRNDFTGIS
jgi:hypothetical protein